MLFDKVAEDTDWVMVSTPRMTPRAAQPHSIHQEADDAVLHAAMQATLATPRTEPATSITSSKATPLIDGPMKMALSKSFEALKVGSKRAHAHGYSVNL